MGVVVRAGILYNDFDDSPPPLALGRNFSERAEANDPRPSNLSSPNIEDNYYESSSLYGPNPSSPQT